MNVSSLLLQQPPFVMIDTLVHYDDALTVTETLIRKDNIFTEDGLFTPAGLMENIAQTCAARIGYINKYILHRDIQIGFIAAVRNMEITECPAVGKTITTKVETIKEALGMILSNATITVDNKVIVTAEVKMAVSNEEENMA